MAYKLRNRHSDEWIQCSVEKIIGDGIKFEIKDLEPDETITLDKFSKQITKKYY